MAVREPAGYGMRISGVSPGSARESGIDVYKRQGMLIARVSAIYLAFSASTEVKIMPEYSTPLNVWNGAFWGI